MGFFSKLFGRSDKPKDPRKQSRRAEAVLLTPDELSRRLKVPLAALTAIHIQYRDVTVKKRRGGKRILSVPDDALKQVQRTILRKLFKRLDSHPAAHGFEPRHSIVTNAKPHVGKAVVLKMDVKNFFPATSEKRVNDYFRILGWNPQAADILTRLTTHRGGLPQGAPTSPRLSNLINVPLDARLASLAKAIGATYTRYADDMTFSLAKDNRSQIAALIKITKDILEEYGYKLHQDKKLQIRRRYERQQVTGIVVNEKLSLPREERRRLRAIAHHLATGRDITCTPEQLEGHLAYKLMIESAAG